MKSLNLLQHESGESNIELIIFSLEHDTKFGQLSQQSSSVSHYLDQFEYLTKL